MELKDGLQNSFLIIFVLFWKYTCCVPIKTKCQIQWTSNGFDEKAFFKSRFSFLSKLVSIFFFTLSWAQTMCCSQQKPFWLKNKFWERFVNFFVLHRQQICEVGKVAKKGQNCNFFGQFFFKRSYFGRRVYFGQKILSKHRNYSKDVPKKFWSTKKKKWRKKLKK